MSVRMIIILIGEMRWSE